MNNERKVGIVPATISRFGEHVPGLHTDTEENVEVWADSEVPQVLISVHDTAYCFGLAEAEVLETAIRVARQGMRRR